MFNGFTLGGGRRRRKNKADLPPPEPAPSTPDVHTAPIASHEIVKRIDWPYPQPRPARPEWQLDTVEADLADAADAAIVRPYAWTRGRTKSAMDMRIEALVTTSELGEDIGALTHTEHRSVAELCAEPRSVAEVATLLHVPLGVAKVLLGDMAGLGLVIVHKTATGGANKAHLMLMERVLSGLRRL
ncbi:MAG: DUF742 domain-containing protein [Actinophytocola sp.]|nr:DUF742 domain-containing protein [Actinophytocola sp.]